MIVWLTTSDEDKRRERNNRVKRVIKSCVKETAVVGVLAVMGISLFVCKSKASNLKMETQLEQEIN